MSKRKKSGYQSLIAMAKGFLRLLVYILLILVMIFVGKSAYQFGYDVFDQQPIAESEDVAMDVTVVIHEGDSVYQIGKLLAEDHLIESPAVFWVQEKLSDYSGKIKSGTYILNTSQTVAEMLEILSGENTEGQPESETASQEEEDQE